MRRITVPARVVRVAAPEAAPSPAGARHRGHGAPAAPAGAGAELRVVDVIRMLLRHPRLLTGVPVLCAALAVALTLLTREYTVTSRFMPKTAQMPGGAARLAGLASQFGVSVPVGGEGETPDFYAQLLRSSDILGPALTSTYRFADAEAEGKVVQGTLLDLLEIEGDTEAERLRAGVEALRGRIASSADLKTNLVSLTVTAPSAELAVAVNRRLLELVQEFNAERRQSQASLERKFVQERVAEAEGELRRAERALGGFIDSNRAYSESPQRTVEFQRLQREVALRQQVHTSLAQAYETARIEEIRDMPVVTLVERPDGMAERKGSLLLNLLLALVVGTALAVGLALAWEFGCLAYTADPGSFGALGRFYAPRNGRGPTHPAHDRDSR
jgi:uncharacterized protein involved in exopolysaccharide biosynthesis